MLTDSQFHDYITTLDDVWIDDSFGNESIVYKRGQQPDGKIIAVVTKGSAPLQISLRCDPQLAKRLRDTYETVMPGQNVNKKHWNTILCTGQLGQDEIFDLVRLSHQLGES